MADDRDSKDGREGAEEKRGAFTRLGEQITGLLDREGALRRGQDLVAGVTAATKDEIIRLVSAEVRNFLEKMDAVELAQQVIAGLVVDVQMQVRFSRSEDGLPKAQVARHDTQIRSRDEDDEPER